MNEIKECEICGRTDGKIIVSKKFGKTLCNRHYLQIEQIGHIKRTKYDRNEIVIKNGYAELVLYDILGNETSRALIDIEDVENVKQYKWCSTKKDDTEYVSNQQKVSLHRFVTNCPKGMYVDHINHNGLDNRKKNLRICTNQENLFNSKISKRNKSGVTGVYFSKDKSKWVADITLNRKTIHLGAFVNKEEAILVRKAAEKKYFGKFAFKGISMPKNTTDRRKEGC
jgi:AP2 domain.